jgi:hypothetical protein
MRQAQSDAAKRRKQLLESADEDDEENSDEGGNNLDYEQDQEDSSLLRIDNPAHLMPLSFLPKPRNVENATQPLVVMPIPHPAIPNILEPRALLQRSEMDVVNGNTDTVTLLGEDFSSGTTTMQFAPSGELLGARTRREDGMFVGESPVLASLLLSGEQAASQATVAGVTISPQLALARVTQRTLRDLQRATESERVRQAWADLSSAGSSSAPRTPRDSPAPALAPARLLQQLSIGPMTQLIENPVDTQIAQPVVPDVDPSYGGRLGSWSSSASTRERLGTLPGGDRSHKHHRSTLRVHVHKISLLDHPLVGEEERAHANLRSSFALYRSLMEQHTLVYLTRRLIALYDEVVRLSRDYTDLASVEEKDRDEDELETTIRSLHAAYFDLIETLPSLTELRIAVDSLTAGLYDQWTNIQKIRANQGGRCYTKAVLVARRVKGAMEVPRRGAGAAGSDGDEEGESAGESKGGEGSEAQLWTELSKVLGAVPDLVRNVQKLLLAADKTLVADPAAAAAAEAAAAQSEPAAGGSRGRLKLSPRGQPKDADTARSSGATPRSKLSETRARYQRVAEVATVACSDLLKCRGLVPEYALRLSDSGSVTPTAQVPPEEQRRRRELEALTFKVAVRVNGVLVTQTTPAKLSFPSLMVEFRQYFEFRLLHQPTSVSLDVISVKKGFNADALIASVGLPLPGQKDPYQQAQASSGQHTASAAAISFTPSVGWLSFSSEGSEGQAQGSASAPPAGSGSQTRGKIQMARIVGLLLCAAEYDASTADSSSSHHKAFEGIQAEDLARLPPVLSVATGSSFSGMQRSSRAAGISQRILQGYENLDPNDPRNDLWLRSAKKADVVDKPLFRLEGLDFAVPFGEDGAYYQNFIRFQSSARMRLLKMRELKPFLFSDPIPMTDAEITRKETFKALLALEPDPLMNLADEVPREETEVANEQRVREKVSNFMARVRQSQVAQSVRSRKKLSTTSAVAEVAYFKPTEVLDLNKLFPEPKRGLRPITKDRQPTTMQVQKCYLLVQVVGARNVPLREERTQNSALTGRASSPKKPRGRGLSSSGSGYGSSGSSGESDAEDFAQNHRVGEEFLDPAKLEYQQRARTFVEVRFQEHSRRTVGNAGRSPLWKESLAIPFRPPQNDFTPANLAQVRDNIYFSLFDEEEVNYSWSGSFSDGESTIVSERRYLGSFELPFSTLWAHAGGRVEGVFRLDVPCLNFGYVPAPPLEIARSQVQSQSMFREDPNIVQDSMPLHRPSPLESFLALFVGPAKAEGLLAGWSSKRQESANDLIDYGTHLRPALEKEFEFYAGTSSTTFVKLMITLDPILASPTHIQQDVSLAALYSEDKPFAGPARVWLKSVHAVSKFTKERPYSLFGNNTKGLSVLHCRYLVPMRPPPGFLSRRAAIHLVSMLPFMADAQAFQGESDMWCTCKEAWDTGAGDEEEHAVILYNYLYYLQNVEGGGGGGDGANANVRKWGRRGDDKPSSYPSDEAVASESVFLVIGKAVPEGTSVYVMIRDTQAVTSRASSAQSFIFINPCTGQLYPASDPRCPMVEVACIVTPYNVWANVQVGASPYELEYDILNPDHWRPFFGRRLPPPSTGLHSIQEDVTYAPTSTAYALDLERSIKELYVDISLSPPNLTSPPPRPRP